MWREVMQAEPLQWSIRTRKWRRITWWDSSGRGPAWPAVTVDSW